MNHKTTESHMDDLRKKKAFICDMDGVIYQGNHLIPGVEEFLDWLKSESKKFLFLTNSSERTTQEQKEKMLDLGLEVAETNFYTSALATAEFLSHQSPNGSAFVIGGSGILNALGDTGFSMNGTNPDYVVVGTTRSYDFDKLEHVIYLVRKGAKLIGTNPDLTGLTERGIIPATGALVLSGVTTQDDLQYFAYRPDYI